ncbi:hypothetical protein [Lentzea sp. CA-135723]|uniref:hypothetical protein n=1 Tax=Lentzea sp. CA-135723 TaxID=3239950 RepID=UPI003D8E6B40
MPLVVVLAGVALVMPNAAALALSRHGRTAGTAAAVLGAARFLLGSAVAPLVGVLGNGAGAVALVMTGSLVATLVFVVASGARLRRFAAFR